MRGFAKERIALSAVVLALYMSVMFLVSLQAPDGWGNAFLGMAACYGVGFWALVTRYFWGRWFAMGIGISGLISAVMSIAQIGPEPVLVFYGGTHALAIVLLMGKAVASAFDGRTDWRERFHLDESSTNRLGKSIIRVGVSLPYIVMYALAPREGAEWLPALAAAGLAGAGVWGMLRMRTWGVLALAGGAVAIAIGLPDSVAAASAGVKGADFIAFTGAGAVVWAAAAALPMVGPIVRHLRSARM